MMLGGCLNPPEVGSVYAGHLEDIDQATPMGLQEIKDPGGLKR